MSRLTEPKAPNRGKSVWRHLTADELRMVAEKAQELGTFRATGRHFGITPKTVRRALRVSGMKIRRASK